MSEEIHEQRTLAAAADAADEVEPASPGEAEDGGAGDGVSTNARGGGGEKRAISGDEGGDSDFVVR